MSGKENVSAATQQVNTAPATAASGTKIKPEMQKPAASSTSPNPHALAASGTKITPEMQKPAASSTSTSPQKVPVAATEEEFPDDIQEAGADDLYGDALDSGWMSGLKGAKLIREAECLISCALLRRDSIAQPCTWVGVFADTLPAAAEDAADGDFYSKVATQERAPLLPVMCSISNIRTMWMQALQTPIHGNVLAALCLRFGPAWAALQEQLQRADNAENKSDRATLRKKSYDAFSSCSVLPSLSVAAEVDMRAVVAWMQARERALEVLELQVSRSALVMEPMRQEIGTLQLFGDMCRSLGMPGLTGKEVLPLCCSAMLHAHLSADMPCPVEVLEKFCMDRALQQASGSEVRPMLMSLLRPKQYEHEQLLRVLSNQGEYRHTPSAEDPARHHAEDEAKSEHGSDTEFVRVHAPPAKHLLVLLNQLPRGSGGAVSVLRLRESMREQYAHLDAEFLTQLTGFWCRGGDTGEDATLSADVVHAFFCPGGLFGVRVRTPMNFGFKIGRPLKPTDPTEVVYQATIKQMFARLKTFSSLKYGSRVPGDVKLYADAEMRRLIPRSKTIAVGNQVDDGDKLWAASEYISECMSQVEEAEQEKLRAAMSSREKDKHEQKALEKEMRVQAEKAAAAAKAAQAAGLSAPAVPAPSRNMVKPKKGEKSNDSLQAALDKLMVVSAPIHVPPYPPFPGALSDSHQWGIPLMVKYLRDEVELRQYTDQFLRMEMTGLAFLKLTAESVTRMLSLEHPLHAAKLAYHARVLRDRVLEKAAIHRPQLVQEWEAWHVSGWLVHKAECPTVGHHTFTTSDLDGTKLLELYAKSQEVVVAATKETPAVIETHSTLELRAPLGPPDDQEAELALHALLVLLGAKVAPETADLEVHEQVVPLGTNPGESRLGRKRKEAKEATDQALAEGKDGEENLAADAKQASSAMEGATVVKGAAKEAATGDTDAKGKESKTEPSLKDIPAPASAAAAVAAPKVSDDASPATAKKKDHKKEHKHSEPVPAASAASLSATPADVAALQQNIAQLEALVKSQGAAIADLTDKALDPVRQSILELRKDRLVASEQLQTQLQENQKALLTQIESINSGLRSHAMAGQAASVHALAPAFVAAPTAELAPAHVVPAGSIGQPGSDHHLAKTTGAEVAPVSAAPAKTVQFDAAVTAPAVLSAPPARKQQAAASALLPVPASAPATFDSSAGPAYTSLGKILGLGESRALQDAAGLVAPAEAQSVSGTSASGTSAADGPVSLDFQAIFNRTATDEIKVWKGIVRTYGHRQETNLTVTDTSAQLGRVACLWLRLGLRMLDDSRRRPSDFHATGEGEDPYLDMEIEEEDESGAPRGLTRPVIGALRGMVKCVRMLLQPAIPDILHHRPASELIEDAEGGIGIGIGGDDDAAFVHDTHSTVQTRVRVSAADSRGNFKAAAANEKKRTAQRLRIISERQHDYEVAAGLVFCLALVRRLLDKYPNHSDYTTLLFLFTRLREGTLPLAEISRDNFRMLLTDTLRCQLPSWPQFDSMCRRFDPQQKGFITTSQAVQALRNINPLTEGLGPGDAQGISLLILSTAASQLAKKGKDIDGAFLEVIFGAASRVQSFGDLVGGRDKRRQARYLAEAEEAAADGGELTQTELDLNSMRMADETLLVQDLLTELVRPVFERIQDKSEKRAEADAFGGKRAWAATIEMGREKAERAGSYALWRREQQSASCPLPFVEPTPATAHDACELTTRGLQIFEGRSKGEALLQALGTVLSTQLLFRVVCLRRLQTETLRRLQTETQAYEMATAEEARQQLKMLPHMSLTIPQISNALGALEADLTRLLGKAQTELMLSRGPEDMSLEELERLMCELSGIAIPHGGVFGLYHSQVQVEIYLYHNWTSKTDKALAVVNKQQQVYMAALKDISSELLSTLRGSALLEDAEAQAAAERKRGSVRARELDGKVTTYMTPADLATSHLLTDMNQLMHRQRVDQAAMYLNFLNTKATARRRKLEAALYLTNAVKRLGPGPHPHIPALDADGMDSHLSPQEITRRAHDLQAAAQEDMRVPPPVHMQQLARRVAQVQHALLKGSVVDADDGLLIALREIQVMEKQLLQANSDLLGLTQSIVTNCKKYM